jgi:hypothetical protein
MTDQGSVYPSRILELGGRTLRATTARAPGGDIVKKLVLALTAMLVVLPATAHAEPPDGPAVKVSAGTTYTWDATPTTGLNVAYWGVPFTGVGATSACGDEVADYCETRLFELSNPLTQADIDAGRTKRTKSATITINNFGPVPDPVTDYDLLVFDSDANGTRGDELATSTAYGHEQAGDESVTLSIVTTLAEPSKYVFVEIVYFAVVNSSFKGTVQF